MQIRGKRLMHKIALALLSAAALTVGTGAQAADVPATTNLGTPLTSPFNFSSPVVGSCPAGSCTFMDTITFDTPLNFNLASATLTSNFTSTSLGDNLDFLSATFNGNPFTLAPNGQGEYAAIFNQFITSGTNTIIVSGNAGNGSGLAQSISAGIAGQLTFAQVSSVPEPATWAMMLLGFGGIGFSMRRRPKQVLAQIA